MVSTIILDSLELRVEHSLAKPIQFYYTHRIVFLLSLLESNAMGEIYLAKNKTNGKCYVGLSTNGMEYRRRKHENASKRGSIRHPYFYNAIRKYGEGGFEWTVLHFDIETIEELNELEIQEIAERETLYPNGYNLTAGGSSGLKSEDTRKRMSESQLKVWDNEEHRIKASEVQKAAWDDEERRRLASKTQKAIKADPEIRKRHSEITAAYWEENREEHLAKIQTPEVSAKISEANKRDWETNEKRKALAALPYDEKYGEEKSAEIRQKQSEALLDQPKSEEAKENMRIAYQNKTPENKANSQAALMKHNQNVKENGITDEHRKNLSESHKGKKLSEETKAKMRLAQQRRREREKQQTDNTD